MPRSGVRANRLLKSLLAEDAGDLASVVRSLRPSPGQRLGSMAKPATEIWFPLAGVIALSITDDEGRTVQTGMVGPEGCVGLETLFSGTPTLADATVQVAGEFAVIPANHLRSAVESRPAMQAVLAGFLYDLSAQSLQTVACNRLHSLESRCCRWLLMTLDRTGDENLPLTQERLAAMLGSGRPRVNGLLSTLEKDGLVRRQRGNIRLLSRPGLEHRACECYRLVGYKPKEPKIA